MRRAAPIIVATAGGIALLANFRTTPEAVGGAGTSTTAAAHTTAPPRTTTTVAPTTTTAAATRTIDGPDVLTRYGDVQVRVVLRGTHLTDVEAIRLPAERQRSAEISQYAAPRLRQEALQAQSARIDVVSGASYTSDGYAQSLQGALDAAG